jgi:hypothetical protein
VPAEDFLRCDVCGRGSVLRRAFVRGKDGSVSKTWCPPCAQRRAQKLNDFTFVASLVCVPVLWPGMLDHPNAVHVVAFAIALFQLCFALMIVPHELGHAFLGWLAGYPPIAVVFGSGRVIFERRICGVHVRVGRLFQGGLTMADVRDTPYRAARMLVLTLGGVLANAAICVIVYELARSPAARSLDNAWSALLLVIIVANALHVVTNLWPHIHIRDGVAMRNDGALILSYLRGELPAMAECRASVHAARASIAFDRQDFATGLREARAMAAHSSNQAHIDAASITAAAALCELGDPVAARDFLTPLLARADLDGWLGALARNNLAWVNFLVDDPLSREQGLELSLQAFEALPWNEAITITRASLLCVTAPARATDLDEARRLLASLGGLHLNRQSSAYAALARGLLAAAENNFPPARAALESARGKGATAMPLRVLQRRIASP